MTRDAHAPPPAWLVLVAPQTFFLARIALPFDYASDAARELERHTANELEPIADAQATIELWRARATGAFSADELRASPFVMPGNAPGSKRRRLVARSRLSRRAPT